MMFDPSNFFTDTLAGDDFTWTSEFFSERFPQPVSPLGWSILKELVEEDAFRWPLRMVGARDLEKQPLTKLHRGHPYANAAVFQAFYARFPRWLMPEDAGRYFPHGLPRGLLFPSPQTLLAAVRFLLREPLKSSFLLNPLRWHLFLPGYERRLSLARERLHAATSGDGASLHGLLGLAEEVQRANSELLSIHRWSLTHGEIGYAVARRLARHLGLGPVEVERALAHAPRSKSREMDETLRRLAAEATSEPELAKLILDGAGYGETRAFIDSRYPHIASALNAFLERYGHRSSSLDIATPSFADEPAQVLTLLAALLRKNGEPLRKGQGEEKETWKRLALPKRLLVGLTFSTVRRYLWLREDQRFYSLKAFQLLRWIYLRVGEGLVVRGYVSASTDVLFLTKQEVAACVLKDAPANVRRIVEARRAEMEGLRAEYRAEVLGTYPTFLRGNLPYASRASGTAGGSLRGKAVSGGRATGPARVVRAFEDLANVKGGDVLVAPGTDPAWTPVFTRIAGLIMERGGQLSHGAVVAREYGLPAVASVPGVTRLLRDGDLVTVDGCAGTIEILR